MAEPREYLEELGTKLAERGLKVRIIDDEPPLLHMENPGPPELREVIGCRIGTERMLWFH